jgi:Protein kinase domain
LRYYGEHGSWNRISYQFALSRPKNYFRDQIVFVGVWPKTSLPDGEPDEFCTPYTRWTDESSGGVEILLTEMLNLLNDESLRLPSAGTGFILLLTSGSLLALGLPRLRPTAIFGAGAAIFILVPFTAIGITHFCNYWFPWLIITGAQLPCAMAFAWFTRIQTAKGTQKNSAPETPPVVTGHKIFSPAFGHGAYGSVWLAREKSGLWRAVKTIRRAQLGDHAEAFAREFHGVKKYQPVSAGHPHLLRVLDVSEINNNRFYYLMELADALDEGWQTDVARYAPRDLARELARQPEKSLPLADCLRLGIALGDALDFLHRQGLTHRDVKPENIIFVDGQAKLADPGLLTEIKNAAQPRSLVGTPGFMPPEAPGTARADIYSLGMVLYVAATGQPPAKFPDLPTRLLSEAFRGAHLGLNIIVLKACQPNPLHRHASAAEMKEELEKLLAKFPA